ncbi:nuclear valosin-containing protein-like [Clavelina lepadiformis]|uniref:AAA+ ATPase domain-containing protein n=1 Tax=Clavelina lepadiformis TaxID=159417 RepID=A0ABP0EZV1_CLALP
MPTYTSFDRALPLRIKKYVATHKIIDLDVMVADLQKQYKNDYGRRKRNAFRKLVAQVHKDLKNETQEEFGIAEKSRKKRKKHVEENLSNQCSSSDCSTDDEMQYVEYSDTNMMNQSLSSLYNKQNSTSVVSKGLSSSPQPYEQQIIKPTNNITQKGKSSSLSWFIDKTSEKGVMNVSSYQASDKVIKSALNAATDNHPHHPDLNNSVKEQIDLQTIDLIENEDSVNNCSKLDNSTLKEKVLDTPTGKIVNEKCKKNKRLPSSKRSRVKRKSKQNNNEKSDEEEMVFPQKKLFSLQTVEINFSDVAGNDGALRELARLLLHMNHPEVYSTLGVSPPRGVLLHGPPGCGKTLLGKAIAGQLNMPLLRLVGPELVAGVSGESERRVRDLFETAQNSAPCVLFLDEIDAVAQKRDNSSKEMEKRIVSQLLACLDELNQSNHKVMVVGATNRPDTLDPALRRAGRFDREICLGIPNENARRQILKVMCNGLKLEEDINFNLIARLTPGYVGADLLSLCREAAMQAVTRIFDFRTGSQHDLLKGTNDILKYFSSSTPFTEEELQKLSIETGDFELAIPDVQPSAKREGFATVPGVTWDDVGALESVREELSIAILGPVRNPAIFSSLGLSRASGVLLAGPPGCGKTLLAKAIANESGINFISVKGPELLNMYVGESERAVRQCFERARDSSPCVIFFDELDSLCPRRSSVETGASARVVNQMLTELDGLESRKQVFVVAATNRPDIIDPAILRPGRLDKTLYVGIPSPEERVKILVTITKNGRKPLLDDDVCFESVGKDERCNGFTGADLSALMREAALNAVRKSVQHQWNVILPEENTQPETVKVTKQNIDDAFSKVHPSISNKDRLKYAEMKAGLHHS